MSRIAEAFAHGKAFIPFVTCGDPDLATTGRVVRAMVDAGATMVELGIPFSDPMAEGPVIQAANVRALEGGVTVDDVFAFVRGLREDVDVPLVFMTYANVVFSYGVERFARACEEVGVDGVILPDVPLEERREFAEPLAEHGVDLVSMVAPTSADRVAAIARDARGFIYVVSSLGVTGTRSAITTNIPELVALVRESTDLPCAVGFGISTPQQAHAMAQASDGAIVGSAIVKLVAQYGRDAAEPVGNYVRSMVE